MTTINGFGYPNSHRRPTRARWKSVLFLVALLATAAAAVQLALRSGVKRDGEPIPEFSLPPVKGRAHGLSRSDLKGSPSLVNVFTSWCGACWEERPVINAIAASQAIPVYGLNYRDDPDDAARWLAEEGDPYKRTGADTTGSVTAKLGVRVLPETLLISAEGRILRRHRGPMTDAVFKVEFLALIEQALGRPETRK